MYLASGVLMAGLATACADGKSSAGGGGLRASGSTTVAPVAADAAEALKAQGMNITIATQGGSAGGISQLAAGQIDIALSSKPIAEEDRTAHPKTDFVTTQIGSDAVGVIVTKPVADAGVKNLTADQVRGLFEGKITNWSELGGPKLDVFVYDKEPGRGTREVLDKYVYGTRRPRRRRTPTTSRSSAATWRPATSWSPPPGRSAPCPPASSRGGTSSPW
ncbi:hypothetical protein Smic_01430 [Streptomyces microflavus]|uniref:PBP domain-containing protein n=1 Tax=Streptomyces microflavus TaxID=1919 RepID=A0A7J0CIN5_STRMI|nr:hypothetical protein Smic_01430 [Streptomyces microflavus]